MQAELDALRLELAQERSAQAAVQANLDALRKELQALKDANQASLITTQQESAKAAEEYKAMNDALAKAQAEAANDKAIAETKLQTSKADYKDMHDSLTQLVEEANKGAADNDALVKELKANLKVKDAEIAELKVRVQVFLYHLLYSETLGQSYHHQHTR